ncbi:GAF domain-containing protein [Chondromyces apiculatus]|uniref:histidine kinase n=1 Tax=Chondromyces apiculatus DSM 436 TaxID=1192034 RepID=A0A017TE01_9BACT|nr:GAF domain-containing protein [Chondromyces apiculatus]EYF07132.1 Two-component hybrid sensor and regulator [Chondromyces apiculatus DSM 436]
MATEGTPPHTTGQRKASDPAQGAEMHKDLMFLADASEQLTGSLNPQTILERLARLAVPYLADFCTVDLAKRVDGNKGEFDLRPPSGEKEDEKSQKSPFRRVTAAHVDPEKEKPLREVVPEAEGPLGIARVLKSGQPQVFQGPAEGGAEAVEGLSAQLAVLGARSVMAVPMMARGRRLGVLSFGVTASDRVYSTDDLVLASELAHRAALALDNAYLYRKAEEARKAAEKSADRAAWLFAVTAALSDAITPAAVLRVLASEIVAAAGGVAGAVAIRTGGTELEVVRNTGYLDTDATSLRQFDVDAILPLARAVRDRQPLFLESDAQLAQFSPAFVEACREAGEHAYAAIPLFLEGRVLGAVGFAFTEPRTFSDDERAFMLSLVQQGAQALERARLSALQTEEAMHLSHEVLRQMPEAILITDLDGNIRQWLGEAESIFGYLAEEIVGKHMSLLHREDIREESTPRILQAIESMRTFVGEIPCARRDGSEVPIEVTAYPVHDQEGRPLFLVGIHRDITDRKRAEEERARLIRAQAARAEAEEAARRFSFLAEVSTSLTASLDFATTLKTLAHLCVPTMADFCVVEVPEGDGSRVVASTHTDPTKEPLLAQFLPSGLDGLDGDPRSPRAAPSSVRVHVPGGPVGASLPPVLRVLKTGRSEIYPSLTESSVITPDMLPEQVTAIRQLAPTAYLVVALRARGRIVGALALGMAESRRHLDAAAVSLAEEVAYRAAIALDNARLYRELQDANRLKDEFLGTVSYELRTPLNAILGWARMIHSRSLDASSEQRAVAAIERNAEMQTTLIDELLDASRIITGTMKIDRLTMECSLPIQAAIDAILPSAAGRGVAIQMALDPTGVFVEGDPGRLQQVVWHLLSNAVKFTRAGGVVSVRLTQDDKCAEIAVVDTGEGIVAELLPYVFDRFRQGDNVAGRRHGGLGLGLSIVKHVVELHGGTVEAASGGNDRGSTFIVRLPLSRGAAATALGSLGVPPEPRNLFPRLTGVRVLIVDDDEDTQEMLSAVLRRCGADVRTASSARAALDILQGGWEPSLLVSDIAMPGEDGYTLIRRVREMLPRKVGRTPALALTAYGRVEDRVKALSHGYQMHVQKPIEPMELAAAVKSLATGPIPWPE